MGLENGYYFFDHKGFRFVIMDENCNIKQVFLKGELQ